MAKNEPNDLLDDAADTTTAPPKAMNPVADPKQETPPEQQQPMSPIGSDDRFARLAALLVEQNVYPHVPDLAKKLSPEQRFKLQTATAELIELAATRVGATVEESRGLAIQREEAMAPLVADPDLKNADMPTLVARAVATAFHRAADVALGTHTDKGCVA